jgi:hypothetical protein
VAKTLATSALLLDVLDREMKLAITLGLERKPRPVRIA